MRYLSFASVPVDGHCLAHWAPGLCILSTYTACLSTENNESCTSVIRAFSKKKIQMQNPELTCFHLQPLTEEVVTGFMWEQINTDQFYEMMCALHHGRC